MYIADYAICRLVNYYITHFMHFYIYIESKDVEHHSQHNFAETLLGGIMWTGVTSSAGIIGYVIGDDVGVYTGALCALVTGVLSINVLQWGYRTFSNTSH